MNLNTSDIKIPELNIPGVSLGELNDISDITSRAGELGAINSKLDLPDVNSRIGVPGEISQQAQAYLTEFQEKGSVSKKRKKPEIIFKGLIGKTVETFVLARQEVGYSASTTASYIRYLLSSHGDNQAVTRVAAFFVSTRQTIGPNAVSRIPQKRRFHGQTD